MNEYYYWNGTRAEGPHNLSELRDLLKEGVITPESQVCQPGDAAWQDFKSFPEYAEQSGSSDINSPTIVAKALVDTASMAEEEPQKVGAIQSAEDKAELKSEVDEEEAKKPSRHQLLRVIRKDLDALWECQREAIIAAIKNEELGEIYQVTRKQNKDIYKGIESAALRYWRISGVLRTWISDLTWKDADFTRRLRGKDEMDRYQDLQSWLEDKGIAEYSGCYCFKSGSEYKYIGRATVLRERIKQHERAKFFTYPDTAVRVAIPKYKTQIGKMERLLILLHEPSENRTLGDAGKNRVVECREFIYFEINKPLTDF